MISPVPDALPRQPTHGPPGWSLVVNVSDVRCEGEPPRRRSAARRSTPRTARPRARRARPTARSRSAGADDDGDGGPTVSGPLLRGPGAADAFADLIVDLLGGGLL